MSILFSGDLIKEGERLKPARCAVVYPCDEDTLSGAVLSGHGGFIHPVIYAPKKRIEALAEDLRLDLSGCELIDVAHEREAAEQAAEDTAAGKAECLMKGSLHTDLFMKAILAQRPLRTGRRMSHVYYFNIPAYHKPLLLSDCALNIHPGLEEKADITQNVIDLAHILGEENPKVAILSAVETVTPTIISTLDAAALCKMADRRQITGAVLDGPLAFDNAISPAAAKIKKITSPVAGDADILIVPDLVSGNMLGKQLEYFANGHLAGLVMGCRVPVILTSRADNVESRRMSALLAQLVAHHNRERSVL